MNQRFSFLMLACFCVGLLSGYSATLELSGDLAAREIFTAHFHNRSGVAYQWAEDAESTYRLRYTTKTSPGEMVLGRLPLLCIVNFWNPVAEVSSMVLGEVLQGKITNWQTLGGENRLIEVLVYPGQRDLKLLGITNQTRVRTVGSLEAMVAAVSANPGALAIVTWPLVSPSIKVLTIDGVNPAWLRQPLELATYPFWTQLTLHIPPSEGLKDWFNGKLWRKWRFERELAASFSPEQYLGGQPVFTIAAAGDMMFSRKVATTSIQQGDYRYPFLKVAPLLRRATLAFANLEGPLSDQGRQINMFRADPRFLDGILYAGIDLVSLANNHIMDYGTVAFLDTMKRLTAAGVCYVGAGDNLDEARQGCLLNLGGVKVGFLAYTELGRGFTYTRVPQHWAATKQLPGVVPARVDYIKADIERLKIIADIVIVSFHWGKEYEHLPTVKQQLLAETALAAGANLVLGHHPHVIQGLKWGTEGVIAYSLGNFIFDQTPDATREGLILEAACDRQGIRQIRCTPLVIKNEQPRVAEGDDARRIMNLLSNVSRELK